VSHDPLPLAGDVELEDALASRVVRRPNVAEAKDLTSIGQQSKLIAVADLEELADRSGLRNRHGLAESKLDGEVRVRFVVGDCDYAPQTGFALVARRRHPQQPGEKVAAAQASG
jgi:hypothetical protein